MKKTENSFRLSQAIINLQNRKNNKPKRLAGV